jgi:hypothetical protein
MSHSGGGSQMMGHKLQKEPFYLWYEVLRQQAERREREGIVSNNRKVYEQTLEDIARRQKEIDDERKGKI